MTDAPSTGRPPRTFVSMPHALGRGSREDIVWEALERIDGKPAPEVESMQAAMGNEAQIRLVHDVIRAYLDAHDLHDTRDLAAHRGGAA